MLMLAIAAFGWAFAAAAYAHEKEGWRQESSNLTETDRYGVQYDKRFEEAGNFRRQFRASWKDFIWNAIRQIPNAVSVISFNFQHRLWLVILFAVLEGGAVGLGYIMEKVGEGFVDTPEYP
ncbi:MAG: hypothetical protein CME31_21250 [Gimesia sp.]|uniref:Uncharacterized protein n=2 Tax=Gimesia maris TaxID=122 RepID=A0A3D3RBF3_9PLAN|nr:hypothetical protein [Gimesia sp.]HCO26171.1 hypothetical protein [Gimesia maris]|tara:strand:+ start:31157 stop:31519 length:363 start_codon:yes stop_codon:yes gene_type:complete